MRIPKTLRGKITLLRKCNNGLSFFILVFALYLALSPYVPEISYALAHREDEETTVLLSPTLYDVPPQVLEAARNNTTMLFVPSIGVAQSIMESNRIEEIHEKIWHRPYSSTPPAGSNTVFVAHRYATIGGNRASTFYHLPKVVEGDDVYVTWGGVIYRYRVSATETVLQTDTSIEERTDGSEITLYTCTPLWKADKRFVVHGTLITKIPYEDII